MSKRIYAITSENKIIEFYDSISYCGLVFDMSPYKIKCLIENETKIEHPANFGKVTLKFDSDYGTKDVNICNIGSVDLNLNDIRGYKKGFSDDCSDTVITSKDGIEKCFYDIETECNISVLRPDSTESETLDDTESLIEKLKPTHPTFGQTSRNNGYMKNINPTSNETVDNTESLTLDRFGGYKKGFANGDGYKPIVNTESLTKEIKQLNSKIKSLQDIIDGYNEIYANLVDLNDNKVFELESENSRLKNQCNLMTLYLNKIRRKVGFYLYEDYIMNENDGIRLKEKLENIIERVAPKIDEK